MCEEGAGQVGVTADPACPLLDLSRQDLEIVSGEVGQVGGGQVAPEVLDGIEFGRIGGEPFGMEPMPIVREVGGGVGAAVGGQAVPQQHDPAVHVAPETAQKGRDPQAVDGTGVDGQQQPHPLPADRGRQGAGQRQPFPIERLDEVGCVTLGRPCPADAGALREPRFVEEDQRGVLGAGFFLTRGQRCLTQ